MPQLLDSLRHTGRTTRMLAHAKKLALEDHRAVYVIADNDRDRRRLEMECFQHGEPNLGIKFETPETLLDFSFKTMTIPNAHPNCVFLVDHRTIEDRFARVLKMLHAYDERRP